jgi:3-oxoacyl-[acyl-carrier-protein] synthase I
VRRVAVTGLGAVCSLGGNIREVEHSLRESRSGIVFNSEMRDLGFHCQVYGPVKGFNLTGVSKRALQTLSPVAQYALAATLEAVAAAGLDVAQLQGDRIGVVIGSIMGGINESTRVEQVLIEQRKPSRAGGAGIVKIMNTTAASHVASYLGTHGRTYSLSSACATGPDSIGHAFELIALGLQDVCIAGATDEDCWKQLGPSFDNWNGMPSEFNDQPARACRPFDMRRGGLVIAAGAGVVVLEEMDSARRRGAPIYAEIAGYGSSNDGWDMFQPSGRGAERCVRQALERARALGVERIDYINPHGAGTPIGDKVEVEWIKSVFGNQSPSVSSTKGLSGHAMGAAGALEAVYTLLMMHGSFIAPTVNLDELDPECAGVSHVLSVQDRDIQSALTVNAGLGGTNGCLVFRKV